MNNPPADKIPLSVPNPGAPYKSPAEAKSAGRRWGLDEFVEVVNSLVERYLPAKRSFNVKLRDAFNPRLVRYYATFGLISPPEREGKEARYHYGHLLQALVIRRLLFEGYTAPVLLKMFAGKTEADYEAMLAGGVSVRAAPAAPEEFKDHITVGGPESLQFVRELPAAAPPSILPPPSSLTPSTDPAGMETILWRRLQIAPGLELHVRSDFVVPETRAKREALLLSALESLQPVVPG